MFAAAGVILLLAMQAIPSGDEPTVVAGVEVRAGRPDRLLTVVISGDVAQQTFVATAPLGMNCGGAEFQHNRDRNRQCWLRARRGSEVLLGATGRGAYGRDWTVDWVGCRPLSNGSICRVVLREDMVVGAVFRRP